MEKIARGTPGFSGADLKNLLNEASLMASFQNKNQVEMDDLERARDKVIMGSERKSFIMSDKDKKITAYHEAGHAIVGMSLPLLDPIHKVTIVPRGMALGVTQTLPKEDLLNMSKQKAQNTLSFLFGGRVAEENIFEDYTSGASNDIEKATDLARRMVCEWGMSSKIGPLFLGTESENVFMGRDHSKARKHSEQSAKEVDAEIQSFISNAYDVAKDILKKKAKQLHTMSEALLEFETIDSEEVKMLLDGKGLKELKEYRKDLSHKIKEERSSNNSKKKKASSDPKDSIGGDPVPTPV